MTDIEDSAKQMNVYFLITPGMHLLDFSGPCQAFDEAKTLGLNIKLHFISDNPEILSNQGVLLSRLESMPAELPDNAIVIACASKYHPRIYCDETSHNAIEWLKTIPKSDTKIVGICTGAFALGLAGWLVNRNCTTHYKLTKELAKSNPSANVVSDRIFIRDGQVYTTAGVTAGIDLTLKLIEDLGGARCSMEVAKDLIVYRRRLANDPQISNQISYRNHISPVVHSIQDYIQSHLNQRISLSELSAIYRISIRHIQREFKRATGLTVRDYIVELRLEEAKNHLSQGSTIDIAAFKVGFPHASALRTAWKKKYNSLPSSRSRR